MSNQVKLLMQLGSEFLKVSRVAVRIQWNPGLTIFSITIFPV